MNLYITNCSNTFNYGSMMMGENFISYFERLNGAGHCYFVETNEYVNVERLKHATGVEKIYPVALNALIKNGLKKQDLALAFLGKRILSEFGKKVDLVVALGGDDFIDDRSWKDLFIHGRLAVEGKRVVLFGQTMGPYSAVGKYLMKYSLKKVSDIYLRDEVSYRYLQEMGLKNIRLMDDLALLPLARQEMGEPSREFVVFCPSELIYRHAKEGGREEWVQFNLFAIKSILDRYEDKKLVLLAHVLKPDKVDDRKMVRELYQLMEEKYQDRILVFDQELYPYQVREYIQRAYFTVSGRMHPVVSTLQCEKPSIAFSYSSKYHGIIGNRFNLKKYILDIRDLRYNVLEIEFLKRIEMLEREYPHLVSSIREINRQAQIKVKDAIKGLQSGY